MSSAKPLALPAPALHRRILLVLSCTATLSTLLFTVLCSHLSLFDSSPRLVLPAPIASGFFSSLRQALASAVLRWDAFHFAHIANEGYVYEHEAAFFPEAPIIMRFLGSIVQVLTLSDSRWEDVLLGGLLASMLTALSVVTLYDLTLAHMGSPNIALLASLLSLLPSSPVTLRVAGYAEPFFTSFSYVGMLACARSQWLFAAWSFTLASTFRSNGVLLSGFIVWGVIVEPFLNRRKVSLGRLVYAASLCLMITIPFAYHHFLAYRYHCINTAEPAPWCGGFPPLIYTYVQSKYWNGGLLRYWTLQQLPNFLLAAPPLTLLFTFTILYTRTTLIPHLLQFLKLARQSSLSTYEMHQQSAPKPKPNTAPESPFFQLTIAPHAIHALATSLLLLLASHTQIVLRFAAAMPLTYWAAAWLLVERPPLGKLWVGWSVVWGAVSCVLWATFLPPA